VRITKRIARHNGKDKDEWGDNMSIFSSNRLQDYNIIIGCGRLGANIANALSSQEKSVLIIDSNKDSFRKLSPHFGWLMITGDATSIEVLQEANIEKADHVIVVTDNDNTNIMVAQMTKELFKVADVVARIYDTDRLCILENQNVATICPGDLSINKLDRWIKRTEEGEE